MTKQGTKATSSETAENQDKIVVADSAAASTAIKKPKFDKDELLVIFDEMIFSGEYEESVTILSKLKVSFRARSAEDTTAISRDIDSKNFTLISTLQEYRSLKNLAYSLISYAGKDLKNVAVEERGKIVNKLPAVMVGALSKALVDFDMKIAAACEEGEANF